MHPSAADLAEYLEHDPFMEFPEPPVGNRHQQENRHRPSQRLRRFQTAPSVQRRPSATNSKAIYCRWRWRSSLGPQRVTKKEEYKRRAAQRDRKWGKAPWKVLTRSIRRPFA